MFNHAAFLVRHQHSLNKALLRAIDSPNLSLLPLLPCFAIFAVDKRNLFVVFLFICLSFFPFNILNIVPRPLFCSVA